MTWTVKTKYTRPNTDVAWYTASDSGYSNFCDHIQENYKDTGKRISHSFSAVLTPSGWSENELEMTMTFVYRDEAAAQELSSDSTVETYLSARDTYNDANNISRTVIQNEET